MRLPEDAARALEKLESAGWESYAVGGCVRDSLLGIEPHDWDLCTAAPPEAMKKVFAGERVIEIGLKHGTLTLLAPSGPLEITTFRTESGYSDCRHPDRVSFVRDIHADLARRDFTVNAMAYSPVRGLRDDFGGREDLRNGVLRCVGDPGERFREDALRILRALRFAGAVRSDHRGENRRGAAGKPGAAAQYFPRAYFLGAQRHPLRARRGGDAARLPGGVFCDPSGACADAGL